MTSPAVLFVDDDADIRLAAEQAILLAGLDVTCCSNARDAQRVLQRDWTGILVTDIRMPGQDGLGLMRDALAADPDIPVVLITGHGDVATAVQAMRDGAYDFIEKPFAAETFIDTLRRAIELRRLKNEINSLKEHIRDAQGIDQLMIGQSEPIMAVKKLIQSIAETNAHVVVNGETGSGKEVVARAIHETSGREGPFVAINCAAMPETIFEAELFGHEAGAFTGADKQRVGKFEYASKGTLFLDEIESMPLTLQVKLLRAIQEQAIERLGSNTLIPVDTRVIAASKENLRLASQEGRFREDLYYRLNVVELHIPPLRERKEDIPLLYQHFIERAAQTHNRPAPEVTRAEMGLLAGADWPGNVRELRNAAERRILGLTAVIPRAEDQPSLPKQMEQFEKSLIVQSLRTHNGCIKDVIAELQLPRKTFYDKLSKYGIKGADYRK